MPSNMYLKFEKPDVNGSCRVVGHENEIEVLSWTHGFVQQAVPVLGQDAGDHASHANLSFSKNVDTSTTELLRLCWSGKQIGRATLMCYRPAASAAPPEEYLSIVMEHVIVTGYNISGGPAEAPIESVSLDYGIISYEYKHPRYSDGTYTSAMAKHNRETRTIV